MYIMTDYTPTYNTGIYTSLDNRPTYETPMFNVEMSPRRSVVYVQKPRHMMQRTECPMKWIIIIIVLLAIVLAAIR